jgi:hypothetical protein
LGSGWSSHRLQEWVGGGGGQETAVLLPVQVGAPPPKQWRRNRKDFGDKK